MASTVAGQQCQSAGYLYDAFVYMHMDDIFAGLTAMKTSKKLPVDGWRKGSDVEVEVAGIGDWIPAGLCFVLTGSGWDPHTGANAGAATQCISMFHG